MRRLRAALAVLAGTALAACGAGGDAPDDAGASDAAPERKTPPPPLSQDGGPPVTGPDRLSETGLYSDFASRTLAPGVMAFAVRYPLWSDGAVKQRYLWLPDGQTIDTSSMDDWMFPVGTKAWKEFRRDGKLVETRLLWKVRDGAWFEMGYAWSADGSDAIAAPHGATGALGTPHDIPPQEDCTECHHQVSDELLGVSAIELSDGAGGPLAQLATAGRLSNPPGGDLEVPGDPVVKAALGYMHGNCGYCHSDRSDLHTQSALRLRLSVTETSPEQTGAYRTTAFLPMKHQLPGLPYAVVPGDPAHSGIVDRMSRRDDYAMPPVGTNEVDPGGVAAVSAWIAGLPCGPSCASAPATP